jgi:hypothetical protein
MSVKERLKEYISFKKISERTFCKTINVVGTFVNNIKVSIQPEKLHRIMVNFPDLNTEWLLTGAGKMLKPVVNQNEEKTAPSETKDDILTISDLVRALNNISEAIKLNAQASNTNAIANNTNAIANDRNSRTMERMLDLLCEKDKLNMENRDIVPCKGIKGDSSQIA